MTLAPGTHQSGPYPARQGLYDPAFEHDASDVHLISGHVPMMRVHTVMTPMDYPVLTAEALREAVAGHRPDVRRCVLRRRRHGSHQCESKDRGNAACDRNHDTPPNIRPGGLPMAAKATKASAGSGTLQEQNENQTGNQGRIMRQAGLLAQLRSSPTTHHSTSQVAPISPKSSPIR